MMAKKIKMNTTIVMHCCRKCVYESDSKSIDAYDIVYHQTAIHHSFHTFRSSTSD